MIRNAKIQDLPAILKVYEIARKFMADNGNAYNGEIPSLLQNCLKRILKISSYMFISMRNRYMVYLLLSWEMILLTAILKTAPGYLTQVTVPFTGSPVTEQ